MKWKCLLHLECYRNNKKITYAIQCFGSPKWCLLMLKSFKSSTCQAEKLPSWPRKIWGTLTPSIISSGLCRNCLKVRRRLGKYLLKKKNWLDISTMNMCWFFYHILLLSTGKRENRTLITYCGFCSLPSETFLKWCSMANQNDIFSFVVLLWRAPRFALSALRDASINSPTVTSVKKRKLIWRTARVFKFANV